MDDAIQIRFKSDILEKSVSPEEIRLVQAHLGDLLVTVLMKTEGE